MENESQIYGNLFGDINLLSEEHLETILSSMNKEYSKYYLIQAVKAAYKRGAFTIGETEVISKAIRILSKEQ